jgi:hypothetical protein
MSRLDLLYSTSTTYSRGSCGWLTRTGTGTVSKYLVTLLYFQVQGGLHTATKSRMWTKRIIAPARQKTVRLLRLGLIDHRTPRKENGMTMTAPHKVHQNRCKMPLSYSTPHFFAHQTKTHQESRQQTHHNSSAHSISFTLTLPEEFRNNTSFH